MKNNFCKYFGLLLMALGLAFANPVKAATIASYTFTNTATPFASVVTAANSTPGSIIPTSLPNSSIPSGQQYYDFSTSDMSSSQVTTKYLQFTVTANSGFYISLVGGSFTMNVASSQSGKDVFFAVRSSVDSFASNLTLSSGTTTSATFVSVGTGTLSGSQYDHLSSVTFRIYGWDGSPARDLLVDNINLAGTLVVSPVPEPGTCALAAMGAVLMGGRVIRSYKNRNQRSAK